MSLCSYVLNLIRKGYIHLISCVLINYPYVGYVGTLYRRGVVAINKKDRPKLLLVGLVRINMYRLTLLQVR